jgi:hypothetical protein
MGLIKDLLGIQTADEQARADYYKDRGLSERAQAAFAEAKMNEVNRKGRGEYTLEELGEIRAKGAETELKQANIKKLEQEANDLGYKNSDEYRRALAERQMADKLKVDAEASKISADAQDQQIRTDNMKKDRARLEDAIYMTSELAKGKAEEAGRNAALKSAFEKDKTNPELMAEVAASNARLNFIGETARHHENIAMISMGNPQQYQSAIPQYFAAQYGYKDNEGSKQVNDQQFKQNYFEVETTTGGGTTGEPQNKVKAFLPIDRLQNFAGGMPNGAMGAQAQADSIDYMKNAFPSGNVQYPIGQTAPNPIQHANYAASGGSTMFTPEPAQATAPKRWVFDPTTGGMTLKNP